MRKRTNPRSGCKHKAWGAAERNPRNASLEIFKPAEESVGKIVSVVLLCHLCASAVDRFSRNFTTETQSITEFCTEKCFFRQTPPQASRTT